MRVTETLVLEGLAASSETVGDAYDSADAQAVRGLFKNEAAADGSPFRTGPLKTVATSKRSPSTRRRSSCELP